MITIKKYPDLWFIDLKDFISYTNKKYINYIEQYGLPFDLLKNKDHQKIYFHFLLKEICEFCKNNCISNTVFFNNKWEEQSYHIKMISKITKTFGIRIYEDWMNMRDFVLKLKTLDVEYIEKFETFLNKKTKPKSFRQIKKFLEKEGFKDLSDNYFSDVTNKMTIIC